MSGVEYNEEFPEEFDLQHDGVEETSPHLNMTDSEFRLHVISMLEQSFNNQEAIHNATLAAFELMEKRLQQLEWNQRTHQDKLHAFQKKVHTLQKKWYGETH